MILSLGWLKEYVDLPSNLTAQQLAHDITMSTVEVEAIIEQARAFEQIVVGVITELKPHPNADRLQIALTDIGTEAVQIICGGSNLSVGMKVAVALVGAQVRWHGQGDPITLEIATVRGETSHGMICAAEEIGLNDRFPSTDERAVIDLTTVTQANAGTPLAHALNLDDVLIDIDNKSLTNRPDLWCHHGMARELSARYQLPLRDTVQTSITPTEYPIMINTDQCFGYTALLIQNIDPQAPTPLHIQQRLLSCGIRPISFCVDMTNYIMLDCGQPMHAFDADCIADGITVRSANAHETLELLDQQTIELQGNDMIIADKNGPIALAGIMGGQRTKVTSSTTSVLFEAATFAGQSIRRSATTHAIRSESSQRHEKGLDTQKQLSAIKQLVHLFQTYMPNAHIVGFSQELTKPTHEINISIANDFITERLGQVIKIQQSVDILSALGFATKYTDGVFEIVVPSWRATGDVSIPEDIVEEIARMYGYDNLARIHPRITLDRAIMQPRVLLTQQIRNYLAYTGNNAEVFTYPWADEKLLTACGFDTKKCVALECPPTAQHGYLQPDLLPNMLELVQKNIHNYDDIKIFQIARVFDTTAQSDFSTTEEQLPAQPKHLGILHIGEHAQDIFLQVKGLIQGISAITGIELSYKKESAHELLIVIGTINIGRIVILSHRLRKLCDLENHSAVYAHINLDQFLNNEPIPLHYTPLPQHPAISRDIAVEVNQTIAWETIYDTIVDISPLIQTVTVFDVYTGSGVHEGKKSIAFRIIFAAADRTLTTSEVDKIIDQIITVLTTTVDATLRS